MKSKRLAILIIAMLAVCQVFDAPAQKRSRGPKGPVPKSMIKDVSKPILVLFTADWCQPCRMIKEITFKDERVLPLLDRYNVLVIDIEWSEVIYRKLRGEDRSIPLIILLDNGQKEIARQRGYIPDIDLFMTFLEEGLREDD